MKEIHKIFSQLSISLTRKLSRQFIQLHCLFIFCLFCHLLDTVAKVYVCLINWMNKFPSHSTLHFSSTMSATRKEVKRNWLASGHQKIRRFKVLSISPQTHNKAIGNSKLGKARIIFQKLKRYTESWNFRILSCACV